jgi:hypothetical protein
MMTADKKDLPVKAEDGERRSWETKPPALLENDLSPMKLGVVVPMKELIKSAEEVAIAILAYTKPIKIRQGEHYDCDDWKLIAAAFGIFPSTDKPHEVNIRGRWGFECRGYTLKNGRPFTEAWHICLWEGREKPKSGTEDEKEYFTLYGKVQTRAQSRALRAAISWVVKIGSKKMGRKISSVPAELAEEAEFDLINNNSSAEEPKPGSDWAGKILMMANQDKAVALKMLGRFMAKAGRDGSQITSFNSLTQEDINSITPYVEEEFAKGA